MRVLKDNELDIVRGGNTTVSSAIINAFTNVIKVLYDAGHGVGSAIRRFAEGELCPLD